MINIISGYDYTLNPQIRIVNKPSQNNERSPILMKMTILDLELENKK